MGNNFGILKFRTEPDLKEFLATSTLADVKTVDKQNLVCFDSTTSITDVFHKLVEHKIHSAPVYDAKAKEYIGLIDWKDLVAYLLQVWKAESLPDDPKAVDVADMSRQNPFFPLYHDFSMLEVLKGFSNQGMVAVHRRPVISASNPEHIDAMVSQMDIVEWLVEKQTNLGSFFSSTTIGQLIEEMESNATAKIDFVYTVVPTTKMVHVLQLLYTHKINGVAIVEASSEGKEGKLIGNISVSDLQYLVLEHLDNMERTVEEFLQRVPRKPLVTCTPEASLLQVMEKLVHNHVYRIYVVDPNAGNPIAVVTLTDVMEAVLLLAEEFSD
ncbi:cell separation during budding [Balamuthia mandrillaris]